MAGLRLSGHYVSDLLRHGGLCRCQQSQPGVHLRLLFDDLRLELRVLLRHLFHCLPYRGQDFRNPPWGDLLGRSGHIFLFFGLQSFDASKEAVYEMVRVVRVNYGQTPNYTCSRSEETFMQLNAYMVMTTIKRGAVDFGAHMGAPRIPWWDAQNRPIWIYARNLLDSYPNLCYIHYYLL